MRCFTIVFSTAAAGVVRSTSGKAPAFAVEAGGAEFEVAPEVLDSELEVSAMLTTHCGGGDDAEYECVLDCMEDSKCRNQPEVISAIQESGVFQVEESMDAMGFASGAPCADFYGDNIAKAAWGLAKSGSTKMSTCAKGTHDATECIDGLCVAYDDDVVCTGNSWKDPKKCGVKQKSCGTAEECFKKCLNDKDCRRQLIKQGAADNVLNGALQVRCVQEEGGKKKCFFTPEHPCSNTCQDSYSCSAGRCKAVSSVTPEWKEPKGWTFKAPWSSAEQSEESEGGWKWPWQ